MAPRISSFKDLKIGEKGWPIEVRPIRKWDIKGKQKYLCCVFVDKQGGVVQSLTIEKDIASVDARIEVMKCYKISDYACAQPVSSVTVVPAAFNIRIGSFTKIAPISDTNEIPTEYYNICDDKIFDDPMLQSDIIIDYISILQIIEDKTTKDGRPYVILIVSDNSTRAKQVKLWEEICTNPTRFNRELIERTPKPIILGFTAIKTRIYLGTLSLTSTPATYVYVQPKHKMATQLSNKLTDEDFNLALITTQGEPTTIAALLEHPDQELSGKTFVCEAFIQEYKSSSGWYYTKCPQCSGIVWDSGDIWMCTSDGYINKPNFMYRVIATIADATASMTVVIFDETAVTLTGKSCEEVILKDGYKERKTIPPHLTCEIGKFKKFSLKIQEDTSHAETRFTVKKITNVLSLLDTPAPDSEQTPRTSPSRTGTKRKLQFTDLLDAT